MKTLFHRLLFVVVVLLVAVGGYYVYDTTRERTPAELKAGILHDADQRVLSDRLVEMLEHPNPELRAEAALAIGRIGTESSGRLLFPLLGDPALDVAATAAFALGLTNARHLADDILDIGIGLPSSVVVPLVESAGRLIDSSRVEVLATVAGYLTHPSPEVREAAVMAMLHANARGGASGLIEFVAQEQDDQVRQTVLYVLSRFGAREGLPLYIEYLADEDPFVRACAVRGLGRSASPEAEHYLAIALNDNNPNVVATAISALGRKESPKALNQLVRKLSNEIDPKLIASTLGILAQRKNADAADLAQEIIDNDPPYFLLGAALNYLATVKGERAVPVIDSIAQSANARFRVACARAYQTIGTEAIIPRIAVMLSDEDPLVRSAALPALIELDTENRDFYLNKGLNDRDFVPVVEAVNAIGSDTLYQHLPTLHTMMTLGKDIDVEIRRSLVMAAGDILRVRATDTVARQILVEGIMDDEYVVRREAAGIYRDVLDEDRMNMVPPAQGIIDEDEIEVGIQRYQTNPFAAVMTSKGEFEIELRFDLAPVTVLSFIERANNGFYEGLMFHRVIPGFVAQGGDPRGDGWGGPADFVRCEYSSEPFRRGTVGMATSGKDTGGSQFFVTLSPQPHLNARYTVFGQVTTGMEIVDRIVPGDVIESITIYEGAL